MHIRSVLAALCLLLSSGCGYHLVTAHGGGPTDVVRLGEIVDATPWGDLGLRAQAGLRGALAQRTRPKVVQRPGTPVVRGRITSSPARPAGYGENGDEVASEVAVVLALRLEDAGGDVIWHSGPIRRVVPWHRGRTPVDSVAARRHAGERAVDAVVDEGIRRFLAAPPREGTP